jgi:predicted proteasome-type protease
MSRATAANRVDQGLVFASDSRTNAGAHHVSTYSKMHTFERIGIMNRLSRHSDRYKG